MFKGKENAISAEHLKNGEECIIVGFGQSMTPILKSGQPVRVFPITDETILEKNDIVFVKVNGHFICIKYLQLKMVNHIRFQIIMVM